MSGHGIELTFDDRQRAYQSAAERARTQPANGRTTETPAACCPQWPEPLTQAAFYGLSGEFVRLVGPHCEGDPAALLVQFLHNTNMFACLVGMTSKARKGCGLHYVVRTAAHSISECNQEQAAIAASKCFSPWRDPAAGMDSSPALAPVKV